MCFGYITNFHIWISHISEASNFRSFNHGLQSCEIYYVPLSLLLFGIAEIMIY